MKRLLSIFALGFMLTAIAAAQTSTTPEEGMNKLLAKNIKYPNQARINGVEGLVVLQANFDPSGQLISATLVAGDPILATEVERAFGLLKQNWKTEYLGNKKIDDSYLMSFNFRISKPDSWTAGALGMNANSPKSSDLDPSSTEGSLNYISNLMDSNPYDFRLYEHRAELYDSLHLDVLAQKDRMLADYFRNKMLSQIVIIGYQSAENSLSDLD